MKPIISKIFTYFALSISMYSCSMAQENKVLIIGIDGCRPDALLEANTKNIDSLWQNGAFSFKAKTDEISSSGICWTGMLTGVWHDKHNVVSNDYKNPNIKEYPHFFRRVKQYNPELKTYSFVHWAPLHKILQSGDADVSRTFNSDDSVATEAVNALINEDVDVMFLHLDDVDHAGHGYGYHPSNKEYLSAIEVIDQQVGRIVQSLHKRSNNEKENWLILLSTDHGGSGTSHGENTSAHTTIFYIASGNTVRKGEIEDQVNVIDVAVAALVHLEIPIKDKWNLDGKPAGLK